MAIGLCRGLSTFPREPLELLGYYLIPCRQNNGTNIAVGERFDSKKALLQ